MFLLLLLSLVIVYSFSVQSNEAIIVDFSTSFFQIAEEENRLILPGSHGLVQTHILDNTILKTRSLNEITSAGVAVNFSSTCS